MNKLDAGLREVLVLFEQNKRKRRKGRRRHTQHTNTYIATTETYQQRLSYA